MKFKNQINKQQRKKDILVISVFLILSIFGMFCFFGTEMFIWTFNIYLTPYFYVACIHFLLSVFLIIGLVIVLKPVIKINENALLIIDAFHIRKKILLSSVNKITAENNQVILDGKYEYEAMIVDVFCNDKTVRFALAESDYDKFFNCPIAEKSAK